MNELKILPEVAVLVSDRSKWVDSLGFFGKVLSDTCQLGELPDNTSAVFLKNEIRNSNTSNDK